MKKIRFILIFISILSPSIYSLNTSKTITNPIPPGKYTFNTCTFLKETSNISEEKNVVVITVPPYWKQPWEYIIYTIIVISISLIIIQILNTLLALKNKIRTEQQLSELKLKSFTNFSHELRIPLTLIEAPIAAVLTKNKVSADVHENLSIAMKNIKRMSQMVNEILVFRKVMKGKVYLNITATDIVQLIKHDIIPAFKSYANEKNITLTLHSTFNTFKIWIDKNKIQHVMFNLLSNAFKFTPKGGAIQITIFTKNKNILITVSDTGIGIPTGKLQLIFERFVQFEIATGTDGSGIGLSLSKEYINLHQGKLWAANNANGGAKFFISLPIENFNLINNHLPPKANTGNKSTAPQIFNYNTINKRTDVTINLENPSILLVENNTELRIFMFNQLIDNYQIFEAEDGEKGIQKAKKCKPSLIISDVMMPVMDGLEMTKKLKNNIETRHIPIILLTAKSDIKSRLQGIKYGADCYIIKPFNMNLLNAHIKNLIIKHRGFPSSNNKTKNQVNIKGLQTIVTKHDNIFIENILQYMESHYANSGLKVDDLSNLSNLSRTSFYMKFKSLFGNSPIRFINDFRLTKAEYLIKSSRHSMSEISYKVGFDNPGYFNRRFKEKYNCSPGKYAKIKGNL